MTVEADASIRLPLAGLSVVVTGNLDDLGFDRDQAQAAVVRLGGKAVGSVSAKTGLVVTGKGAGLSKMDKARRFKVRVLDGAAFAALVADPASWDGEPVGAPLTPEPAVEVDEPVRSRPVSAHRISSAVIYPNNQTEVRLSCSCGHKWRHTNIHAASFGCPQDPDRPDPADR